MLERALSSLDAILAQIKQPSYLAEDPSGQGQSRHGTNTSQRQDEPTQPAEPPLQAQRAYLQGRQEWKANNNFRAIRYFEDALRLVPTSYEINRQLGLIYFQTGNQIRGASYLERAVALNPNDIESLLLLGRQAVAQGRWSDAIAILAFASQLESEDADPGFESLIRYLLGSALVHEGYDQAGVGQLLEHLNSSWDLLRTTRLARELLALNRQRAMTWQVVGDAQHRLGRYNESLVSYKAAAEAVEDSPVSGGAMSSDLALRLVYTGMRSGQQPLAQQVLLGYMSSAGADETALDLARYLAQYGRDHRGLLASLRSAYDQHQQPEALALVVASLMDPPGDRAFLRDHLRAKPLDEQVFTTLVGDAFRGSPENPDRAQAALNILLDTVEQVPNAAKPYAEILVKAAGKPGALAAGIEACPEGFRRRPLVGYVWGQALAAGGQVSEAIQRLTAVAEADPGLGLAKVALIELLIENRQFDRAQQLLDETDAVAGATPDTPDTPDASEFSEAPEIATLRVRLLRLQGRLHQAISLAETLIAGGPHNSQLVLEKARVQADLHDFTGAENTLVRVLKDLPQEEEVYRLLINLYETGKIANAPAKYQALRQRMLKEIPSARITRFHKARGLMAAEEYDQARALLEPLVKEDPDDFQALDALLTVLVKQDARPEADRIVVERLDAAPDDRQTLTVALGHYRRVEDEPATRRTAWLLLRQMLADKPLDARSLDGLAQILWESGAAAEVDVLLEPALVARPTDSSLLLVAERHYRRTKNRPRLFDVTRRLLLQQPDSPERARGLAALYLQNDRPNEAIEVLAGLKKNYPGEDPRLYLGLMARALYEAGRGPEADDLYQKAINEDPKLATDLKFEWAMLCMNRGLQEKSEKLLLELLAAEPDHVLANNSLGYTWAARGLNLDRAKEMIQRAVDSEPDNAAYLDSMGWVLFQQGKIDEGLVWLRRAAAAEHGEHPVILDHLGDALARGGHGEEAVKVWEQALARYEKLADEMLELPDDPEMKDLDARLRGKIESAQKTNDAAKNDKNEGRDPDAP